MGCAGSALAGMGSGRCALSVWLRCMMAESGKTWAQLETEIADTMRKWHVWDYAIESPFAKLKAVERRKVMKAGQTVEQRTVTLGFDWRDPKAYKHRSLTFTVGREDTALANLELFAKLLEHLR